jgi:hypothetical protein
MDTALVFAFVIIRVKAAVAVIILEQNVIKKGAVWFFLKIGFPSIAATPTPTVPFMLANSICLFYAQTIFNSKQHFQRIDLWF